jgi:hypothetical protein
MTEYARKLYTDAQILGNLKGFYRLDNPRALAIGAIVKYFKVTEGGYFFSNGGFLYKKGDTFLQLHNYGKTWYIKTDPNVNIIFYRYPMTPEERQKKLEEKKQVKKSKHAVNVKLLHNYSYESSYSLPEEQEIPAPRKKVIKNKKQ